MSMRLKLILSYLVMGFIPIILLICVVFGILANIFMNSPFLSSLGENQTQLNQSIDDILNIEVLNRENPEAIFDKDMLRKTDSALSALHAGIVLLNSDKQVFYASAIIENNTLLPEILAPEKRSPAPRSFHADEPFAPLGYEKLDVQSDFSVFYKELNHGAGTLYLAVETGSGKQVSGAGARKFFGILFWSMVGLILLLTFLVSRSTIQSLRKLKDGVRHIADGDLNFSVKTDRKDEVAQVIMAFEEMRLRLKVSIDAQVKNDENRKELVANISHDLKTPVTAIKGYVEGLIDGVADTPEKKDKYLSTILGKTMALDRMIDDLFLYSSLDIGRKNYHFEEIRAIDLFDSLCGETKLDLTERGFEVACDIQIPSEVTIRADRQMIQRLMHNLTENAAKYSRENDRKAVFTARMQDRSVICSIEDNGAGIKAADMPHIFERFYRADAARTSTAGGTGLGLQISKMIIEDHGGMIWAESEYGKYTRITWTLPVLPDNPAKPDSGSENTETGGGANV